MPYCKKIVNLQYNYEKLKTGRQFRLALSNAQVSGAHPTFFKYTKKDQTIFKYGEFKCNYYYCTRPTIIPHKMMGIYNLILVCVKTAIVVRLRLSCLGDTEGEGSV